MVIESYTGMLLAEAEAERNRLRAVNAELLAALTEMLREYEPFVPHGEPPDAIILAYAAIAKAEQS